jgi:CubicO group peptidase (beta-lactamase class C family)
MTSSTRTSGISRTSGIDAVFDARRLDEKAPSAVFATFDNDGVTHHGSRGTLDGTPTGAVPGPHTAYRIASCTKSVTATVLLGLRDEGRLVLDAPITDFVPAFAEVTLPTADSPVPTVRMLMTMSGGLPTDDPWGDRQESITDDELDDLLRGGLRFDSVPGTAFAYSNLSWALLGRVVSSVTGSPYREVVERRVLEPLGLTSTGFTVDVPASGGLAVGHRRRDDGGWEPLPFSGPGAFSPIGGLFSTTTDLARWARWLASAFDPEGRGDVDGVLSRASRREMQQVHRATPGSGAHPSGYGFGLVVEHHPDFGTVVSHSGGYPGFSAHMRWQTATGLGVVGLENATYAQVSVPVALALDGMMADAEEARVVVAPWPETLAAAEAVEAVVRGAEVPEGLLSENVELDLPLERRRRHWAAAVDSLGGLVDVPEGAGGASSLVRDEPDVPAASSSVPSQHVWHLPARRGSLRLEIRLTPEGRPRVQTLSVRAVPARQEP